MEVNSVNYNTGAGASGYTSAATAAATTPATTTAAANTTGTQDVNGDSYVKSDSTKKYKPDYETIQRIKNESDAKVESFKQLVRKLLTKQGDTANKAGIKFTDDEFANFQKMGQSDMVEIDDETRAAAQELISEDGYYGVKKTSERLFEFAQALTGGDPSQIESMRDAVTQGFEEAAKMFGGMDKMPDITKKTYEATMKKFDEWAASAK